MSARHRRHTQQRGLALPIIIFVGVLLLAAAVVLARRPAGGVADASGAPQIAVDLQKIDYGYVPFGNDKQFSIKVTNTGDGVLRFKDKPYIEILEGC